MPPYQQQQAFPGMRPMGPGGYSPSPQGQQFYAPHPHAPQHANMPPQSIAGTTQLIIHILIYRNCGKGNFQDFILKKMIRRTHLFIPDSSVLKTVKGMLVTLTCHYNS
jgi:hypothetical protein